MHSLSYYSALHKTYMYKLGVGYILFLFFKDEERSRLRKNSLLHECTTVYVCMHVFLNLGLSKTKDRNPQQQIKLQWFLSSKYEGIKKLIALQHSVTHPRHSTRAPHDFFLFLPFESFLSKFCFHNFGLVDGWYSSYMQYSVSIQKSKGELIDIRKSGSK